MGLFKHHEVNRCAVQPCSSVLLNCIPLYIAGTDRLEIPLLSGAVRQTDGAHVCRGGEPPQVFAGEGPASHWVCDPGSGPKAYLHEGKVRCGEVLLLALLKAAEFNGIADAWRGLGADARGDSAVRWVPHLQGGCRGVL